MIRDLKKLAGKKFDIAIIGGGIYGAALAWEASARGFSVALLEKGDFASATSANSMKTIHGGFRYLQHADLKRIRESMRERRALMHIAPHLVHPLPVLVPTYGHGLKGREALRLALLANDIIGIDRNRSADPQKIIPAGRMLTPEDCLAIAPGIEQQGLTGGALFYDAQVYNSERLVLAFLHSAVEVGAQVANYAAVTGFIVRDRRIQGVQVQDQLSEATFDVQARLVVNTAGPWIGEMQTLVPGIEPRFPLVKATNLVTPQLFEKYAVGLRGDNGYDDGSGLRQTESYLFIVPWREYSIVGTSYQPCAGPPDQMNVNEGDVLALLQAINRSYPPANLSPEDVTFVHAGLLPVKPGGSRFKVAQHYEIKHHTQDGWQGLLSVTGVKYTTARDVAEKTVDRVFSMLGETPVPSISARTPLAGGQIENFQGFIDQTLREQPCNLSPDVIRNLVLNYGVRYPQVLNYFPKVNASDAFIELNQLIWIAQTRYAIHEEMAQKLSDIIFRRTDLGSAAPPADEALEACATSMAAELGWDAGRKRMEIEQVRQRYRIG